MAQVVSLTPVRPSPHPPAPSLANRHGRVVADAVTRAADRNSTAGMPPASYLHAISPHPLDCRPLTVTAPHSAPRTQTALPHASVSHTHTTQSPKLPPTHSCDRQMAWGVPHPRRPPAGAHCSTHSHSPTGGALPALHTIALHRPNALTLTPAHL